MSARRYGRRHLRDGLHRLGIRAGDLVMVHASLKALGATPGGPVQGGPATVLAALLDALGPDGTLMAYVSWDRSPYEETLGENRLTPRERDAWPAFDPDAAGTYRGFGVLNAYIAAHPGARRSHHPDASMAAIGAAAEWLVADHPLDSGYGRGSPLERFVAAGGRVLLLGAPLDAVTVLHYAEAIADFPGKRRVSYAMPVRDAAGRKVWVRVEDFDSNGILDRYARGGSPDAVETIARAYVEQGRHAFGRVGEAECHLFDARDLIAFATRWLEARHGAG